jgi:hypothetical protein
MFLLPLLLLDEDGLGDEVGTIFFYMSAIEHLLQLVQSSLRMQRESCVININKRMTISRNHMTFSATNYLDLLIAVPLFFRAFFFFSIIILRGPCGCTSPVQPQREWQVAGYACSFPARNNAEGMQPAVQHSAIPLRWEKAWWELAWRRRENEVS